MNPIWYFLIISVIVSVAGLLYRQKTLKRDKKPEAIKMDVEKKQYFSTLLEGDEMLLSYCNNGGSYYFAVTDKRIIIETKKETVSIPHDNIKKIIFKNFNGNKVSPFQTDSVQSVEIRSSVPEKKYHVFRYSDKFDDVVRSLSVFQPLD